MSDPTLLVLCVLSGVTAVSAIIYMISDERKTNDEWNRQAEINKTVAKWIGQVNKDLEYIEKRIERKAV